jgi:hypothetical protein
MSLDSTYLVTPSDTGPRCFFRRFPFAPRETWTHFNLTRLSFRAVCQVAAWRDHLDGVGDVDEAYFIPSAAVTVFVRSVDVYRRRRVVLGQLPGDVFADLADAKPLRVPERTRERS